MMNKVNAWDVAKVANAAAEKVAQIKNSVNLFSKRYWSAEVAQSLEYAPVFYSVVVTLNENTAKPLEELIEVLKSFDGQETSKYKVLDSGMIENEKIFTIPTEQGKVEYSIYIWMSK